MSKLRLVSWNCNGAFRNKLKSITALGADILIIQKCEDPVQTRHPEYRTFAQNYLWTGPTKNKGVAVFARADIRLEKIQMPLEPLELFLPVVVNEHWPLLACWTRYANSPTFQYIGQLWKFLQEHKAFLEHPASALVGDLNSNTRWDQWDRWWNHSDVVSQLESLGLKSAYHQYFQEAQGAETRPTLFHTRKLAKPYHIDYGFFNQGWRIEKVTVGTSSEWLELSDHMPVCIDAHLSNGLV